MNLIVQFLNAERITLCAIVIFAFVFRRINIIKCVRLTRVPCKVSRNQPYVAKKCYKSFIKQRKRVNKKRVGDPEHEAMAEQLFGKQFIKHLIYYLCYL